MKNFLIDLKEYIKYLFYDDSEICFFNENKNSFEYLKYYLNRKINKKKILLFTFEKIYFPNYNLRILHLRTNIFRELFFLTSKKRYIYSTTPDLDNSIFKKSKFFKTKYIYLQHSSISLIKGYRNTAFKNFDAIQVINKFQYNEAKFIEKKFQKKIRIFKSKYRFLENFPMINLSNNLNQKYDFMIAPTWGTNFFSNCSLKIIDKLVSEKWKISYRPHFMSIKNNEIDINYLKKLNINIDTNPIIDFNNSDYLLSDYSGIIFEYYLIKKKSPILINNIKKKELNYDAYLDKTIEESFREIVLTKFVLEDFLNENTFEILKKTNKTNILEEFITKNFY